MIKKIIQFIGNDYIKAMLFGCLIIIITMEYIESIYVRIMLFIIAGAISLKPITELK